MCITYGMCSFLYLAQLHYESRQHFHPLPKEVACLQEIQVYIPKHTKIICDLRELKMWQINQLLNSTDD